MTRVSGSSSQYSSRSLPDTSALLPTLTKPERPICRSAASRRMAMPSAPLCDDSATWPAGGNTGENDAFNRTPGVMFSRPMQLGPTMRIPCPRTFSTSASCSARPPAPISAKPAVMTTSDLTPAAAQSSTTAGTQSGGTARTARSTPAGSSRADRNAGSPPISAACGWTGYTGPVNPPEVRDCRIRLPILPGSREAPMTATARGESIGRRDMAVACRRRRSAEATPSAEGVRAS